MTEKPAKPAASKPTSSRKPSTRPAGENRVSRHRCGHGESAIVVLSRIFVPGTGFASRPRVHRAAEVDVLTRRSPPGATFIARQRSWAGQSRMA
jgi:hypothetical protein